LHCCSASECVCSTASSAAPRGLLSFDIPVLLQPVLPLDLCTRQLVLPHMRICSTAVCAALRRVCFYKACMLPLDKCVLQHSALAPGVAVCAAPFRVCSTAASSIPGRLFYSSLCCPYRCVCSEAACAAPGYVCF
jgi:hypothetical protein